MAAESRSRPPSSVARSASSCIALAALVLSGCPLLTGPPKDTTNGTPNPPAESFETWNTNFEDVTEPVSAGITTWIGGNQLSIDASNVNSGGKSIRNSGPVDDVRILQTTFLIRGLTGRDSVDLTNKRLRIEIYIPSATPIGSISIDLMSGNDSLTVRANIYATNMRGRWHTYEADTAMAITLGSWRYYDWMHTPSIASSADALAMLARVEAIRVNVGNWTSQHESGQSYFLVDWLGWEPAGAPPAFEPGASSLQHSAPAGLLIGNFVESARSSDPAWMRFTMQHAGCLEENQESTRWPATEPAGDDFGATVPVPADAFFDTVSGSLGSSMFRYLVFDSIPNWLTAKSYDETRAILQSFVRAKVRAYKGKTNIWFLFNEILRYDIDWVGFDGLGLKDRSRVPPVWGNEYSPFSIGPSDVTMIEDAFRAAREEDPSALLFLVDSANEEIGHAKSEACYQLVKRLHDDDTPIDGIGMQAHLMIGADGAIRTCGGSGYPLNFAAAGGFPDIARNVERYAALGLKVVFAEVDVPIYTADLDSSAGGQALLAARRELQADVYRSLLRITLTEPNMPAFVLFASTDPYSWYFDTTGGAGYGEPGLLDLEGQPKPAYFALLAELGGH